VSAFQQQFAQEAQGLRRRMPNTLTHLVVVAVFGIFLPWLKGVEFLDPVILGAYACFGVVFAAPVSAHSFEESNPAYSLGRILVCVLYGELMVLGMAFAAIATVYLTHPVYVGPDLVSFGMCALFGLALSLAVSTIAVWISLQYSPFTARSVVRLIFMALLAGFFFRSRRLPAIAPVGAAIALAVAGLAYLRLRGVLMERELK